MKAILSFFWVLVLGSCQIQSGPDVEYVPESLYRIKVLYDPKDLSFYLILTSESEKKICIPKMVWPDAKGFHYLFGDAQIFITASGTRYNIQNFENGYCQSSKKNGCLYDVAYGASLLGRLKLEDFNVPDEDRGNMFRPDLTYPYRPFFCP